MPDRPRALIVGGSVGGLFAGLLLRRIGWETVVFERATDDLATRGAAIGVSAELFDIMRDLGLPLDESDTGTIRSYVALDRNGGVIHEEARQALTAHWANVYRPLRRAFPSSSYRAGAVFQRIEPAAAGVAAVFADGSRAEGDLLIGADGIHSAVRNQLMPGAQPRYAGYVAWRGVVEEKDIAPSDRAFVFNHLIFAFTDTELLLCIPLPGEHAPDGSIRPQRSCYIWYRPADFETALPDLCTDASGKKHGVTIPPPLIRAELIDELKTTAAKQFAPVIARIVARAGPPLLQAMFDLESSGIVRGRVALLGDSAFVARPHAVAGVTKAALDAECLSGLLAAGSDDLAGALARYDTQRRDFGQKLVAHARRLGAYIEAGARGPRPDPAVMLRDYGAPQLLRRA